MDQNIRKIIAVVLLAAVLCVIAIISHLTGAGKKEPVSKDSFYFDTTCTISIYDEGLTEDEAYGMIDDAFKLCREYEGLLSKTVEGSDVWNLNHAGGKTVKCAPATIDCVKAGLEYSRSSEGAFDITVGKLVDLWDYHAEDPSPPSQKQLSNALTHVGYRDVLVDEKAGTITIPEGMEIDLGGIAKGYIADRVCEYLRGDMVVANTQENNGAKDVSGDDNSTAGDEAAVADNGTAVAGAVVNFGGNIECVGDRFGEPFKIGIEKPYTDQSDILGTTTVTSGTVTTSGVYERFFEYKGRKYHHILDTKTGMPSDTDLLSVTVTGDEGTSADCDALATICLLYGHEKGKALIDDTPGIEALFILEDSSTDATKGFKLNK